MTNDLPPTETSPSPSDGPDPSHAPGAVASLKQAMRRARLDNAERAGVLADQRMARLGRLEILQDELQPLVAQIPSDVDLFDMAIMPGANPRLFIDMIGFVEMGRDPKSYRLLQDTRHGRVLVAESEDIDSIVDAVTDYVARRLLERDKALAADIARAPAVRAQTGNRLPGDRGQYALNQAARNDKARGGLAWQRRPAADPAPAAPPAPRLAARAETEEDDPAPRHSADQLGQTGTARWLAISFAFLIDLLGSVAFFTILAAIAWYIWNRLHTPI